MATQTTFGDRLRHWRTTRRFSQLALASEAMVSQRHLSFIETGKARPSREMVLHLATILELPLRTRNDLLVAAGFAPVYSETPLDEPAMDQVRGVLAFLLRAHEPNPALVADRRWNVVASNDASTRLIMALADPATLPLNDGLNLARLTFHPAGLRTVTVNWEVTAAALLERLEREVADRAGDQALQDLLDEMLGYPGVAAMRRRPRMPSGSDLLVPIHYRTADIELRLFSTFATMGAPYDITLEELRIETFFAADSDSEAELLRLAT
jgi:transcriptional regulator with XRE-family HTH domain